MPAPTPAKGSGTMRASWANWRPGKRPKGSLDPLIPGSETDRSLVRTKVNRASFTTLAENKCFSSRVKYWFLVVSSSGQEGKVDPNVGNGTTLFARSETYRPNRVSLGESV